MTISDMTEPPAGVEELLPAWLAARYRSRRHLAALVEIGRVLRGVGMTWKTLHRVTEEPAFGGAATEWAEYPAGEVLAMVEKLERVQPWDPTSSSAPMFMRSRDLPMPEIEAAAARALRPVMPNGLDDP